MRNCTFWNKNFLKRILSYGSFSPWKTYFEVCDSMYSRDIVPVVLSYKLQYTIATNQIRINWPLEQEMKSAWDCLVLVLRFQFLITFGLRFSFLKFLVKENGKMLCSETALVGTKHFPKDLFSCSFSQGAPNDCFSVKYLWRGGGGKNRLEFFISF